MEADALYVKIIDGEYHVSKEIGKNVIVDADKKWNVLWIEILNAKKQKDIIDWILFSNINLSKWASYLQNILSKGIKKESMILRP